MQGKAHTIYIYIFKKNLCEAVQRSKCQQNTLRQTSDNLSTIALKLMNNYLLLQHVAQLEEPNIHKTLQKSKLTQPNKCPAS